MHQSPEFDFVIERTPAARALAVKLVTETDLLRLKVIARVHARGLPPEIDWSDLLQEAFERVLDGSRQQPESVPAVAFLAGVMRSIKAEHWRRARRQARQLPKLLESGDEGLGRVHWGYSAGPPARSAWQNGSPQRRFTPAEGRRADVELN
jgi:DNA-directed RNA polymerase specialized sigma24 family protein